MPVMMSGPIVCQLWDGEEQTKILAMMNFMSVFTSSILSRCRYTTLEMYSRHTWSLFGAHIGCSYHLVAKKPLM